MTPEYKGPGFDPPAQLHAAPNQPVFYLSSSGCTAVGHRTSNGFLVKEGARGRSTVGPSYTDRVAVREGLIVDGTLLREENGLRLTTDHEFSSPSAAASVLVGTMLNGNVVWKDAEGRTLGDLEGIDTSAHLAAFTPVPRSEQQFRRRWFETHRDRYLADQDRLSESEMKYAGFNSSADEALALVASLRQTGDVASFQEGMKAWAVRPGTLAFNGFSGQMMLNQLIKRTDDTSGLALLLSNSLTPPVDDAEASAKIGSVVDYVESIRVGAHPGPGHVPFLLSYFWGLADHDRWPVIWASAARFIEYSTGESLPSDPAGRYMGYLERVRELTDDNRQFEATADWWGDAGPVFLDKLLIDRCAYGADGADLTTEELEANARVLVSSAAYLGQQLVEQVSAILGRSLKVSKAPLNWTDDRPRADLWVDWWSKEAPGLGFRIWVNEQGAAVALRPGLLRTGWYDEAGAVINAADFAGCRVLGGPRSKFGEDVGFFGRHGEFVYGRWFGSDELADMDLRGVVVEVTAQLRPLYEELLAVALGVGTDLADDDDLLEPLVAAFRAERNYPTPADEEDQADRRRFAALLAKDNIGLADIGDLRRIWTTGRYGNPGAQSLLSTSFRDADAAEYDRIINTISYLCWGDGEDSERIDQLLEAKSHSDTGGPSSRYAVAGLGESVIMKLLAICHPDLYLPVFPYSGPKGKRRMLQLLGIDEPCGSRGELQVRSNRALHERLDRHFPGDPLGMTAFLYWYLERNDDEVVESEEVDVLGELAEELLVEKSFLEEIVALLKDKGQVILYGPPGTGKTYLARKLAEALAPDPTRRSLVQFHPSSSYEDFFEGYRPEASIAGDMTYRLTPGPLALMAEQAADAPGKRHVMIIDEINRANLPKVFGELLFLLEYRGESVRTLYRPDDNFQLPQDLWFIGTMNTADRSIALVDAALRRRFHFIPFFPNHGPMEGLLDRWLAHHDEPAWVGELVSQVNDELEIALGGPHLQLGPSHFMKPGLDEAAMRRIWKYNIEPFVEDQFFGDRQQIDSFRFDAAYQRYLDQSGATEVADFLEPGGAGFSGSGVTLTAESDPAGPL